MNERMYMNVRYKFTPCHRHNNTGTQTHTHAAMVVWVWFSPLLFVCSSIMFSLSNVFVLRIIVTFLLLLCSACTFTLALLRSHARPKARNTTKHKSICSINFYMTWEHFSPMAFVTTIHCHVHHDINVNVTMARSIFPAKWKCSLFTCENVWLFLLQLLVLLLLMLWVFFVSQICFAPYEVPCNFIIPLRVRARKTKRTNKCTCTVELVLIWMLLVGFDFFSFLLFSVAVDLSFEC